MSIKDLQKPLSCVTHWNLSLLSNRKKNRKGTGNGFGASFSNQENKQIYFQERKKNFLFHTIIFSLDFDISYKMERHQKETMGTGAINLNKIFSSFNLGVKEDEEHKIMKVKVQKISVITVFC